MEMISTASLKTIETLINKKTKLAVEIIDVETNVSDMGHFLDCHIRFLEKPFQGKVAFVRFEWD